MYPVMQIMSHNKKWEHKIKNKMYMRQFKTL